MKHLLFSFAALALCSTAALAQSPAPEPTPSVSTPVGPASATPRRHGRQHDRLKALSPAEQTKLRLAMKAAKFDPEVEKARANRSADRRAYHQAVRAAILRKDPSMAPILAKLKGGKKNKG